MRHNAAIDPAVFSANVRQLLNEDVRRYRNFGAYWYFVKALLKRFYDRHEMPFLGDFEDKTVNAMIPDEIRASLGAMLGAAAAEYQANASFNLGQNKVEAPDGEFFFLSDPDIEA